MNHAMLFALLFWAALPVSGRAASWFVATNGSDTTGTGAIGLPFRTLNHALLQCASGDVVEVRGGTYREAQTGMTDRAVGHAEAAAATNLAPEVIAKIGRLRWFFTHASVGGNLITGMNVLHQGNPSRYPLAIYNYDGQNGDGDYHGAVATAGSEGGADYRASGQPSSTSNGVIYECLRGNPDWANKLTCFSNSLLQSGWRFPRVNVAMDKFCWIDPYADPDDYCAMMSDLEGRFPQTLIVYMTIPLTTETAGSENDNRNAFNRTVRAYCIENGKWLLDIADLEAWTTNGMQQTYIGGGVTNQLMYSGYAVDAGGGDYHLNAAGRRQAALGWYGLAGALFATDRDGDGAADGDELIAGTCPTNAADVLAAAIHPGGASSGLVVEWTMTTGRVYALQQATALAPPNWSNLVGGLSGVGLHSRTLSVSGASASFQRIGVEQ